jgi:predicted TPR repeat methyltransferase
MPPLRLTSGDPIADRRAAYAEGLAATGDVAAAADLMAQALDLVPGWPAGWFRLGEWRIAAGDVAGAVSAWDRVLALDPADPLGAGVRIDLTRDVPRSATMPPAFIRTLYDSYAPGFEASLVDALGYRGPDMLREAVLGHAPFARVLDLGCGTGLMGVAIRPDAGWLAGCDLSPGMLRLAADKRVYDRLWEQDIAQMPQADAPYDLILAADVFIYLGALDAIIGWAASNLALGGLLAFTVEALAEGEVSLQPTSRYAHAAPYLMRVLTAAGFVPLLTPATLRHDRGEPVASLIVTAVRAG